MRLSLLQDSLYVPEVCLYVLIPGCLPGSEATTVNIVKEKALSTYSLYLVRQIIK